MDEIKAQSELTKLHEIFSNYQYNVNGAINCVNEYKNNQVFNQNLYMNFRESVSKIKPQLQEGLEGLFKLSGVGKAIKDEIKMFDSEVKNYIKTSANILINILEK